MKSRLALLFSCCIGAALPQAINFSEVEQRTQNPKTIWNPQKTTIPNTYVLAAKELLGHGLSDPRGGKLRRVKVLIGNASWSDKFSEYSTIGWVLSGGKKVVLVDGLTYDVASDLGGANESEFLKTFGDMNLPLNTFSRSVWVTDATIALPALLLIRGETKLAEEIYVEVISHLSVSPHHLNRFLFDRYKMQVAHCLMSKRDKESVYWAKKLFEVVTRKGVDNLPIELNSNDLEYSIETVKQILNDTIRRANHHSGAIDLATISKLRQDLRIEALIKRLDEIAVRQMGQPGGGFNLLGDPAVQALIKEGAAAVPALLDAIENDQRLTRSVTFGRDFFPMRTILPVEWVATRCLSELWPSSGLEKQKPKADRVQRLRKIWTETSSMTEPERYLRVLKDDSAGGQVWFEAAKSLTRRIRIEPTVGSAAGQTKRILFGESLRMKHGEELVRLLVKRNEQVVSIPKERDTSKLYRFEEGMQIAHCLAKWDLTRASQSLKLSCENALQIAHDWKESSYYPETMLFNTYALLICDLILANDLEAAKYYSRLENLCHLSLNIQTNILRPLWVAPDDVEIQKIGKSMLNSFLSNLKTKGASDPDFGLMFICDGLRVPLINSPAYREALVEALRCNVFVGSARIKESGKDFILEHRLLGGGQGNRGPISRSDATEMSRGFVLITAADYICQQIAFLKGAVPFSMVWPGTKRFEGIKKTIDWLQDASVDWEAVSKDQEYYDYIDNW